MEERMFWVVLSIIPGSKWYSLSLYNDAAAAAHNAEWANRTSRFASTKHMSVTEIKELGNEGINALDSFLQIEKERAERKRKREEERARIAGLYQKAHEIGMSYANPYGI